jgi:hypothetical protein
MKLVTTLLSLLLLASCADTGRVIFVTTSSFGINVDNKPPTVSIAYDRTEGYIGPRYPDGAVPPVVASIETDGKIFSPEIRQVYATGPAAVRVVGTPNAPESPHDLVGEKTGKRMVFFGTTTTLGLKAGFSGEGYPDSFVFGYKRKEFSYIPLGTKDVNGTPHDAYPSVLASIDTRASAESRPNSSLRTQQFFATGWAADTLATNPAVTYVFRAKAADALTASLPEQQRQEARSLAEVQRTTITQGLDKVVNHVAAANGGVDPARLAALVDEANRASPNSFGADFKAFTTQAQIRAKLQNDIVGTNKLAAAVDALSAR